ncbi:MULTISPECIES: MalY/PatB family protein [Marivita]|uniref:cysteine-S-conjugate beta-lyase n=1 Tax=Marivita cryptomonadis TaxID=505252 RepID=A0A9Q2RX37_9RHOB|nr:MULTISPECIES: PatB family C-S lyase [Marivita]MCR9168274.1 PatB family C-S lyase [Paracoccaceae bacterium]MBM2321511.1 PatB family C-S lyase [Marivita cryptomonadis]MBM2331092.1 PatB family C-S lyase [Marivita cryptomonadis]MBM2340678.1 PatB family C-S lyase [Marivita cryptomonadis]MBM2345340.1 PatB family C-S lyase [Marivita cryptomonadis]
MRDLFNVPNDRRGTHCSKWDVLDSKFDVPNADGIAMWTADSDYPTAPCVLRAMQAAVDHGVFGYWTDNTDYHAAIQWWMKNRHGWDIDTDWIMTTQGLGNAIALCLDVWSEPGDRIVTFNPVYHEFEFKIRRAGRVPVQCPLTRDGDTYQIDFDDAQSRLDGTEKLLIFCSPQNPSGRIWSAEELRQVAAFAARNDLIVVADEIHHDFIYPGHTFVPYDVAVPDARDRSVILTASSKTFNIAGLKTGNIIIPDATLREAMAQRLRSLDYSPNRMGLEMVTAAYTPEGAEWVDAQIDHLIENRRIFDDAMNAIPGVHSLPLASTYLAWVDFSGTGMDFEEISRRVRKDARIAPSPGPEFGPGGETFLRFNLATQTYRVEDAAKRVQEAFNDLQ